MLRCYRVGIVLIALVTASPASLLAADDHGRHAQEGETLGVQGGLFVGALELSLWTILVFVILMMVLRKFAWGPILNGLKNREEGIARDKAEAEQARRAAVQAKADAEAALARAAGEATQMIAKARQDASASAAEEIARGKAELQAERARLRHEMEVARDQALQQIWDQGAQLATLISTKAVGKQLSYDDHRGLLAEALAEFRAAGQTRVEDIESARA